jgi:hypothetical protein
VPDWAPVVAVINPYPALLLNHFTRPVVRCAEDETFDEDDMLYNSLLACLYVILATLF